MAISKFFMTILHKTIIINVIMKKNIGLTLILLYCFLLIAKSYFAFCCYENENHLTQVEVSEEHCVHHHDENTADEKEKHKNKCSPCFEINKSIYCTFQKKIIDRNIFSEDPFDFYSGLEPKNEKLVNLKPHSLYNAQCVSPFLNESSNPPIFKSYSLPLRI